MTSINVKVVLSNMGSHSYAWYTKLYGSYKEFLIYIFTIKYMFCSFIVGRSF